MPFVLLCFNLWSCHFKCISGIILKNDSSVFYNIVSKMCNSKGRFAENRPPQVENFEK